MKTVIRRERDRVWLAGARGWSLHEQPSSVHAAQAAAMWAVGEDVTYDYLLGVSSLAFRMQVSKNGFCPSSPHSFCGCRCVARSKEALPWEIVTFETRPEDTAIGRDARQAVVGSIDRGVPVQYGNEEDGIIVGYQHNGEEWICLHPLRDAGREPFVATERPWGVAVFTQRKPQMSPPRELTLGSLQQAVNMARTEEAEGYWLGFKAWDDYIDRLKATDAADEQTKSDALLGNAWIYECLVSYRASAAQYLRRLVGVFESPVIDKLNQAASLYEQVSSKVLSDESHPATRIAPYPGGPEDGKLWTTAIRGEQVRRLEAALPLERRAIGEIETALSRATAHLT